MKNARILVIVAGATLLCACGRVSNWMHRQDLAAEKTFAVSKVVEPAHPIGVTYDVTGSVGPRKQLSLFFDGKGMARVLEPGVGREKKTLIDYRKQLVLSKNFETNWQESRRIDPFLFPSVLSARQATEQKALCLGTGVSKGFPYHRWGLRNNADEWEVWTDDRDNFPIYFRSIRKGELSSWTMVSSWIDGCTYDRQTFFSMLPDPPPAAALQPESLAAEKVQRRANSQKSHEIVRKHKLSRNAESAHRG